MIKQLLLLSVFLCSVIYTNAQVKGITGRTIDSTNVKSVVFASVSAIRKSDSILVAHTRSNQQGFFQLSPLPQGDYILLVAHNTFIDYVDDINLSATEQLKDVGTINMIPRSNLLKEVFVKNAASIKVKGDTLEFLADSFKVKQGAMVEDLLKVLPGIQVNKKGEITAMGEKVQKVLVDGEEFFGDDPTIATQNIQSRVVEKVQVFDKKSDQATFTGFDDGQEEKTINLKLKKDMNRGEFGKIELGGGWKERWNNQAMINSFKDKRQMSIYGLMSSNGKTGLGWEDQNTYAGTGDNMQMDEDGMFMWNITSENEDDSPSWGNSIPEGITKAWVGGTHYANKWDDNKQHVNLNYSFGRINRSKRQNSRSEYLFPNNHYQSDDTTNSFTSRNTHRISAKYDFAVDSSFSIIYNMSGRLSFIESNSTRQTKNTRYDESPINASQNNNSSTSTNSRLNNQLTFNKKLKKKGRTLSLNTGYNYTYNDGLGKLTGLTNYQLSGAPIINNIDQQKEQHQVNNSINADVTYTEPLTSKLLLKTSYGISNENSHSNKNTMESVTPDEDYSNRIDSLSSEFESATLSHTVGGELKYNEKKYNLALGTRVRFSRFNQKDLVRSIKYDYRRTNLFPTLRFNYKFDQFKRLQFSYSGSTRQPQLQQIQPVQDNSNPLSIYVGNPNLKIGYDQVFSLNYFDYKVLSSRSIYTGFYFTNNYNNIALNSQFDEYGRTINQYVNMNGGYSASIWGGLQAKIPKTEVTGRLNLNGSFAHTPNIINSVKGITNSYSVTLSPGINYSKENVVDFNLDLGTIYTNANSTLNPNRNIRFLSLNPTTSLTVYLPANFEVGTDIDYQYNPAVGPYKNSFSRFLWNGSISYKMLKNNNLEWRASVNDIFNQNKGYERSTENNYNTERNFLTLGRYWMISAIWNFNTGPMAAQAQKTKGGPRPPRGARGGGRRTIRVKH